MTRSANTQLSPQKRRQTRHSRSTEEGKIDESLFNFEEDPGVINTEQEIRIVELVEGGEALPIDFNFSREKIQITTDMTEPDDDVDTQGPAKRGRSLRRSTIKKGTHQDPLSDDLYSIYHRRMEKEEKKMMNRDREKVYTEADKMKSQLEALQQPHWARVLPAITYVRDPRDRNEMEEKREWTINSLNLLLAKFETWRKQEEKLLGKRSRNPSVSVGHELNDLRLYTKMDRYEFIGDSDTDEEENGLSVTEIKRRRLKRRAKKFGPVIKIRFGENVVVAEPFEYPRVEQL